MPLENFSTVTKLQNKFYDNRLKRPLRTVRYDAGTELSYEITTVQNAITAKISLVIDKFVGGGFAGQVYRVKILTIESEEELPDLQVGKLYAMKILVPPSNASLFFRNLVYRVGFGGQFQLQVNPIASRAGAIWQKFIRRAASLRFGDERSVVDIYATLVDGNIGSCGEISEWIDGRNWQLEVEDHMNLLKKWLRGKKVDEEKLHSPEFRAKYLFMHEFVKLLHDLGGHEFARQYEWSTAKSQPNCLKRTDSEGDSEKGLVAVDFRAGLALLPFLPMSPGDFKLIISGILRGSLVQFDRGNLKTLRKYVYEHKENFADMLHLLDELEQLEDIYRNSVPDITHNHFRLVYSKKLWGTMLRSNVTACKVQNIIDDKTEKKLTSSVILRFLYFLIALIPIFGRIITKFIGHTGWRSHYLSLFNPFYFVRAIKGVAAEKSIIWLRAARIDKKKVEKISTANFMFFVHLLLSILPIGLHKFLTNKEYFKERLFFIFVRPLKLYFDAELRREWLFTMVEEGKNKRLITAEDAETIRSKIDEPYIQKYLKSLAVHIMTVPITQVVSVFIAAYYVLSHPELPRAQAWGVGVGIIALFQVIPISPGSLTRGLYVLYLVIKERDFKNYNIAVFLAFFKYVGYLAFPIQMTYRYPVLARFMASHWATEAVHIIPVFGEHGALMEHWIYELFYNWPLTVQRQMKIRQRIRETKPAFYWHVPILSIVFGALFVAVDKIYLNMTGTIPELKQIWWLVILLPYISGKLVLLWAKGAALGKRIIVAAIGGIFISAFYSLYYYFYEFSGDFHILIVGFIWRLFFFGIFASVGAILTEINLGEPKGNFGNVSEMVYEKEGN